MRMLTIAGTLAFAALATSGCAGTVRYESKFSRMRPSPDTATIRVTRSGSIVGAANGVLVRDDQTRIGVVGWSSEVTWSREPGFVAVVAGFTMSDGKDILTHALIFPVEAGKTYTLSSKIRGGCYLQPEDFSREQVAFEERLDAVLNLDRKSISDEWTKELARLQGSLGK
jgi:hypothetical protein